MFYNDGKKKAIEQLKNAERVYNGLANEANDTALYLYNNRKSSVLAIERVEKYINSLANSPKEFAKEIAETLLNLKDFKEAVRIEEENASNNLKGAGMAAGGTAIGGAIAGLGPTAAMAFATSFGVASTGTAISALSGAAATNAALAWLGGGALAAGGGGMSAGSAFLALAGPVGWAIAGVGVIGGGLFALFKNKAAMEEAQKVTKEVWSKIYILRPKLEKLKNLNSETVRLKSSLDLAQFNYYPNDYKQFSDDQKKILIALVNNAKSLGKLINERVY